MWLIQLISGGLSKDLLEILAIVAIVEVPALCLTFLILRGARLPPAGRSLVQEGSPRPEITSIFLFAGAAIVFLIGLMSLMILLMPSQAPLLLRAILSLFLAVPNLWVGWVSFRAARLRRSVEQQPALRYDPRTHRRLHLHRRELLFVILYQSSLLAVSISAIPALGVTFFLLWILSMAIVMAMLAWLGFRARNRDFGTRWAIISALSSGRNIHESIMGWDEFPIAGVRRNLSGLTHDMDRGVAWVPALAASTQILDSPDSYLAACTSSETLLESLKRDLAESLEEFESELRLNSYKLYELFILALMISAGVYGFVGYFIVPKLLRIMDDFGVAVPWPLQFMRSNGGMGIIVAGGACAGLMASLLAMGILHRGFHGEQRWALGFWSLFSDGPKRPLVLRGLASTLSGSRPLEDDLDQLADVEISRRMARRLRATASGIRQGWDWPLALEEHGFLKPEETDVVNSARHAGNAAFVLREIAEMQLRRQNRLWDGFLEMVGPFFVLLIGGCVLVLGYAIIQSLVSMMEGLA